MADFDGQFVNLIPFDQGLWTVEDYASIIVPYTLVTDVSRPVVTLVSPLGGTISRLDPIVFTVSDDMVLSAVFVWVQLASGAAEVIYAPDVGFTSAYIHSQRSGVNPATFTIRRVAGWLSSPRIFVQPVDGSGNLSVT